VAARFLTHLGRYLFVSEVATTSKFDNICTEPEPSSRTGTAKSMWLNSSGGLRLRQRSKRG
jgi:hypothetical protein